MNDTLNLMDAIAQSMYETIRATYPYLSITEYLARILNTSQQEKLVLVEYMDTFKQEKIIMKF